jgi:hypothetical protein
VTRCAGPLRIFVGSMSDADNVWGYIALVAGLVAVVVFVLLVCGQVARYVPRRYRRHSTGQIRQVVDHKFGRFGGTYQEDLIRRDLPAMGRNERCLCGSGKKYKRCCGVNAF